jgi:hypothetical protein
MVAVMQLVGTSNLNYFNNQSFQLNVPVCPLLSGFVQMVNIPSISIGEVGVETSLVQIKHPGDKLTYGTLTVTFLLNEDLSNWFQVYEWMSALGFPERHEQYVEFMEKKKSLDGYDTPTTTGKLILYNNNNIQMKIMSFYDLFPVNLIEIPMTTTDTVTNHPAGIVDFQFTYLTIQDI